MSKRDPASWEQSYSGSIAHDAGEAVRKINPGAYEDCTRWLFDSHVTEDGEGSNAQATTRRISCNNDL